MIWNEETIQRLRDLWASGLPASEIGRRMSTTKSSVIGKAHRLFLDSRDSPIHAKPLDAALSERVIELLTEGNSIERVISLTGASVEAVRLRRKKIGRVEPAAVPRVVARVPVQAPPPRPVATNVVEFRARAVRAAGRSANQGRGRSGIATAPRCQGSPTAMSTRGSPT